MDDGVDQGGRESLLKRETAGSHFVEHDAERIEVGPRIALPREELLGRHVGERP